MTGSQLIDVLRSERSDLSVILATGYGETPTDLHSRIYRLGKPLMQMDLKRAIAEVS